MSFESQTNSCLYTGTIRHRRQQPVQNSFEYKLFMLYIDLDEIESIVQRYWFVSYNRFNAVSLHRQDYLSPEVPSLKKAAITAVKNWYKENALSLPDIHSVRALLHARICNFVFNPVVFYYLFDSHEQLICVLAEITNTPWGERHHYVLPFDQAHSLPSLEIQPSKQGRQFRFQKNFHVSPFMPMNMEYRWIINQPAQYLLIHMDNFIEAEGKTKHFDATLRMQAQPLSNLGKTVIRFPFINVKVITGIYWQALKLWLKGASFYDHPK